MYAHSTPSTFTPHLHHHSHAGLDVMGEEAFCNFILQRTGIVLQNHQLSNLHDTVRRACERFAYRDANQYLHALQQSDDLTVPLEYLIAGITVGESYFFRDSDQIDLLRHQLLPEMIAAKRESGNLSLRIWSAGCAQGQEIYTIALLLLELIPDLHKWSIHLLGTDINTEVVTKAVHGRFTEWSFRATPSILRERWFTRTGHEYEIHPQIKRMVRFAYLNLTVDDYPAILNETNALDLILCRNVFIYLDTLAVQRSMARYAHCLVEQGVLLLGASDPLHYQHTELELVQNSRTGYFRKQPNFNVLSLSNPPFTPMLPNEIIWQDKDVAISPVLAVEVVAGERQDMAHIIQLLDNADWNGVLAHVDAALLCGVETSELWQIKAKVLANTGSLDLALQACERSLKLDSVNKHSYFLMGLILAELDRLQEASEALRKTLYLDHAFLEAHYEMGMLRVRAKDMPSALKSLENALRLAKKGNPEYQLHHAAGMTYRRFAQVLENELAILRGADGAAS